MSSIQLRQNGRIYFGWWILLYCFLLMAIGYAGILSVSSIFVVPVTRELGFTRSSLMVYSTVMMVSSVFFAKIYSVRMGKGGNNLQWIIALNAVAVFLAYAGFSRASQLWHFYGCAILLGSGFAGLNTLPVSLLITNWFGGSVKGTVMAIAFTGSGLGGMVLAPFINLIMEQAGWRQGYFVLGLLFLALLLPFSFFFAKDKPERKGFVKMGQTEAEVGNQAVSGLLYGEARRKPYFWVTLLSQSIVVFGSGALIANVAAYYVECGFTGAQAAAFTGAMSGSLIVGKLVCGVLCDKKGTQFGAVSCFSMFILCFFQLFFLKQYPILIYTIIITYGFGCGATTTTPPLLISSLFGEKDYSKILGLFTMVINLSIALAGLLAAWFFDMTQSYAGYWLISSVGSGLTTVMVFIAFQQKKQREKIPFKTEEIADT